MRQDVRHHCWFVRIWHVAEGKKLHHDAGRAKLSAACFVALQKNRAESSCEHCSMRGPLLTRSMHGMILDECMYTQVHYAYTNPNSCLARQRESTALVVCSSTLLMKIERKEAEGDFGGQRLDHHGVGIP